jgi:hypothetical protein
LEKRYLDGKINEPSAFTYDRYLGGTPVDPPMAGKTDRSIFHTYPESP